MQTTVSTRIRLGAVALGLATILLALFPLVRPFFPLDVFEPARGIALASPAFVSTAWTSSHYLAMLGFVLLQLGRLALYGFHAGSGAEPLALRGLVWSLPGVTLILPPLAWRRTPCRSWASFISRGRRDWRRSSLSPTAGR